jgi:hypothetical protein
MEDGIYFGLDQAEYHKLERLSGSGTQNLMVSPATFWADSWLNPLREVEEEDAEPTPAQIAGTAYHKARLEPDLYRQIYYRGLCMADYPDALKTHDEIKAELVQLGEKAGSDKVLEAARRLRAAGYPGPIKHLLLEELQAGKEDWQIELPWKLFDQIAADMEALEGNAEISPLLHEGESEVSVLWTDDKGVKWKARFDRLQLRRIVDLKTFDNSRGKILEQCLYDAVQYNRYYLQAYVYWTAAELIRAGKLPVKKCQSQAQKDLIAEIRQSPDPYEYWWIWQEKGGIPNVLARKLRLTQEAHPSHLNQAPDEASRKALADKLRKPSMIWEKAAIEVKAMRDLYLTCLEIWPTGPWGAMTPIGEIDDEGFNRFWLES